MKNLMKRSFVYTLMTMSGICFVGGVATLVSERSI